MRFLVLVALLSAAIAAPAAAQRTIPIQLAFAGVGDSDDPEAALSRVPLTRAWEDSVSVYFNAELRRRTSNFVRGPEGPLTGYRVLINAVPMMTVTRETLGITVYSLILFRPPRLTNEWQYMGSSVGYARDPRNVAVETVNMILAELRARGLLERDRR